MTAGSSGLASKRRASRLRFALVSMVLLFSAGFYTGVVATRKVVASDNSLLHRVFGVPTTAPVVAAAAPVAPANPPAAPPVQPPPVQVIGHADQPANKPVDAPEPVTGSQDTGGTDDQTASANGSVRSTDRIGAPTGEDKATLLKAVDEYNDSLHRIQDDLRHYQVIHQRSQDPKTKAADLKALIEQENTLCNQISQSAKRAENMQDAIHAIHDFAVVYMEGSPCAARKDVPTKLLDLDLDKLKFLDKAP